ncbi:MAG: hypothetical protein QXS21_04245 [Thermoproteota archaeon]|nr:hypothetical protein [Candidatus Brockarchaeota archaeon]MBO3802117.1 hypothetical protein [Candidatus Brockarchaeota archaeon]
MNIFLVLYPALEFASGILAIVVALRALRNYNISSEKIFLGYEIAFLLIGTSSLLRSAILIETIFSSMKTIIPINAFSDMFQSILSLISYIVLLYYQLKTSFESIKKSLELVPFFIVSNELNLINAFILLYLSLYVLVKYINSRKRNQMIVSMGYFFLSLSHMSYFVRMRFGTALILENFFRFLGLAFFIVMLSETKKIEK